MSVLNVRSAKGQALGDALYALSFLGAQLAYIPLLVLLLPRRVVAIAPDHALASLSLLLLIGAVTASFAHIVGGAIGDRWMARHGSRRPVIAAGLAGLIVSYVFLAQAASIVMLAAVLVFFQITLNLMFAPLGALMTDYVPDSRKGRVAGLLNAGTPLSILLLAGFSFAAPQDSADAFYAVAALVMLLVLPLLMVWPFDQPVGTAGSFAVPEKARRTPVVTRDLVIVWCARLLMQLGSCLLTNYLYLYVLSLHQSSRVPGVPDATTAVGRLSLVASGTAIVGAVLAGHTSDIRRFRRLPMIVGAIIAGAALVVFADPPSWLVLVGAYGVFQTAHISYLGIDSALVAQIIGQHPRRGMVLGFMNLTNTLPAIISPLFALGTFADAACTTILPYLILACAGSCLTAAGLASRIHSTR